MFAVYKFGPTLSTRSGKVDGCLRSLNADRRPPDDKRGREPHWAGRVMPLNAAVCPRRSVPPPCLATLGAMLLIAAIGGALPASSAAPAIGRRPCEPAAELGRAGDRRRPSGVGDAESYGPGRRTRVSGARRNQLRRGAAVSSLRCDRGHIPPEGFGSWLGSFQISGQLSQAL